MKKPIYKKVKLATTEELDNYLKKYPKTKYLDTIISDLSGIIRGKRMPINDAKKIFQDGVQFCYSTFMLDVFWLLS